MVSKINVKNIKLSIEWYVSKLGFVHDPRFDLTTWSQLSIGIPNVAIGLSREAPTGSGGAVITFVTEDIRAAREALIKNGVDVGEIIKIVDDGVYLVFFKDLDGNTLGLRQNSCNHPSLSSFTEL